MFSSIFRVFKVHFFQNSTLGLNLCKLHGGHPSRINIGTIVLLDANFPMQHSLQNAGRFFTKLLASINAKSFLFFIALFAIIALSSTNAASKDRLSNLYVLKAMIVYKILGFRV